MDTPPPLPSPEPAPQVPKSKWPLYLAIGFTLLPGLMALPGNSDAAAIGALLVAPVGALISGIALGIHLGKTPGMKVLLSCLLIAGCLVASECIAAAGCAIGNPRFNFH